MAAMARKRSTHMDMSVTGGRGAESRPDVVSPSSSKTDNSDILTKSRSRIFFTTLGGKEAAGLYGPDDNSAAEEPEDPGAGAVTMGKGVTVTLGVATDAAAASSSSPDAGRELGSVKSGRLPIADAVLVVVVPTVVAEVTVVVVTMMPRPAEARDMLIL